MIVDFVEEIEFMLIMIVDVTKDINIKNVKFALFSLGKFGVRIEEFDQVKKYISKS